VAARTEVRSTVTVTEAARRLDVGKGRVFQLLASSTDPLDGPASQGRGKGPRLVYEDTIEPQLQLRAAEPNRVHRYRPGHGLDESTHALYERIEALAQRVADLECNYISNQRLRTTVNLDDRVAALEAENRQLQYAKAKSDAASDALRDALREQAKATELRRLADTHDAAAAAALLRAEKAREEAG